MNFCDINCQISVKASQNWDDNYATIAPVTAHPYDVSWIGGIDMGGNISEWTSTIYLPSTATNNSPESQENLRVVKGGDFQSTPDQILSWRRTPFAQEEIRENIGFRCAKRL